MSAKFENNMFWIFDNLLMYQEIKKMQKFQISKIIQAQSVRSGALRFACPRVFRRKAGRRERKV